MADIPLSSLSNNKQILDAVLENKSLLQTIESTDKSVIKRVYRGNVTSHGLDRYQSLYINLGQMNSSKVNRVTDLFAGGDENDLHALSVELQNNGASGLRLAVTNTSSAYILFGLIWEVTEYV